MEDFPIRDVTDPRALRALAHPLRLRILEAVALSGPVTATEIAEMVGESPANCSWHLRQLARYGFVTEAGGGKGRQRPWQIAVEARRWGHEEEEPELARAGEAAAQMLLESEYQAMRDWLRGRHREAPQWRQAGQWTQSLSWCTPEELAEIHAELIRLLSRYQLRMNDPASRPPDARPVRFLAWGVPAQPPALTGEAAAVRQPDIPEKPATEARQGDRDA